MLQDPERQALLRKGAVAKHFKNAGMRRQRIAGQYLSDDSQTIANACRCVWLGDKAERRVLVGVRFIGLRAQKQRWNPQLSQRACQLDAVRSTIQSDVDQCNPGQMLPGERERCEARRDRTNDSVARCLELDRQIDGDDRLVLDD